MWPFKTKVHSKNPNDTAAQNQNVIEFGKGEPFEGLLQKGMTGILDLICPTSIDTTKPDCLVIDRGNLSEEERDTLGNLLDRRAAAMSNVLGVKVSSVTDHKKK